MATRTLPGSQYDKKKYRKSHYEISFIQPIIIAKGIYLVHILLDTISEIEIDRTKALSTVNEIRFAQGSLSLQRASYLISSAVVEPLDCPVFGPSLWLEGAARIGTKQSKMSSKEPPTAEQRKMADDELAELFLPDTAKD
eukprot:IDg1973t1